MSNESPQEHPEGQPGPTDPAPAAPLYPGWSIDQPGAAPVAPPPAPSVIPPGAPAPYPPQAAYPPPVAAYPPPAWGPPGWAPPVQAPKPGVVPLRPLGLSEILDGAFSYIRRHPKVVLGISVAIAALSALVQFIVAATVQRGSYDQLDSLGDNATASDFVSAVAPLAGGFIITALIAWVFQTIGNGMLTVAMSRSVLGQDVTLDGVWSRTRPFIFPLLGLTIVTGIGTVFGLLACLVGAVFLWTMWALAVPALILERLSILGAMRRSWRLVRGSWWRVFGILFLTTVIAQFAAGIVSLPFGLIGGVIDGSFSADATAEPSLVALALNAIGTLIGSAIVLPFIAGVTTLLYVDRRIRSEAFDLELAGSLNNPAAPPAPDAGAPPAW